MPVEDASLMHNADEQLNEQDFVGADFDRERLTRRQKLANFFGGVAGYRHSSQPRHNVGYLEGLKGLIAFEAFLWVFMRCIVPGATFESLTENATPPRYQSVLREVFSPLFWDGNLQASFFVILSARIVCIRFLENRTAEAMAGTLFRRGLRLWFPVAVSLGISNAVNHAGGYDAVRYQAEIFANHLPEVPYKLPTALSYFNAVFNLFWYISGTQAGVRAFPTGMLWIVPIVYQESFTVYALMLLLPYMTRGWRFWGLICFIVVSWWVDSWAWYGATGLLFGELVLDLNFIEAAKSGMPLPKTRKRLSYYWLAGIFTTIGVVLKYVYEDAAPNHINDELIVHTPIYGGGLNRDYDINQPQQRVSSYFLVIGVLMFLEMNVILQKIFDNPVFRYLGRISFGWFLTQSIVIYTVGIQLNLRLQYVDGWGQATAQLAVFAAMLVTTLVCGDVFTRLVDNPSKWLADWMFDWIRR